MKLRISYRMESLIKGSIVLCAVFCKGALIIALVYVGTHFIIKFW